MPRRTFGRGSTNRPNPGDTALGAPLYYYSDLQLVSNWLDLPSFEAMVIEALESVPRCLSELILRLLLIRLCRGNSLHQ
jgi:hypothetical protein